MLQYLFLQGCTDIYDLDVLLRGCHTLTILEATCSGLTQSGLRDLHFPQLNTLLLGQCKGVTDLSGLLRGCDRLRKLEIVGSGVTEDHVASLQLGSTVKVIGAGRGKDGTRSVGELIFLN